MRPRTARAARLLASAAIVAVLALLAAGCKTTGNDITGGMMECSYHTLQQCLVTARGVGGTCIPNPYYEWARYNRGRPYGY